jgi:SNF2 family DNA or RNA helicase
MRHLLNCPMKSVIVANEAGSGKTFTMFGYLLTAAQDRIAQHEIGKLNGPYLPNLILIPSNLASQYVTEFGKSFKGCLDMVMWYGTSKNNQSNMGKSEGYFLGKDIEDVKEWYNEVPKTDPQNCRRILVSTYETFRARAGVKKINVTTQEKDEEYTFMLDELA